MKDNGKLINLMVMESKYLQMEILIKDILLMD
jgi:hypothetical protein